MEVYRNVETEAPDYQPMEYYSSDADAAEWLASISGDYIPDAPAEPAPAAEPPAPAEEIGEAEGNGTADVIDVSFGEESIG
jgi:hypothetical protein